MLATKPSSIKSPIVWQATLQPSSGYTKLYFACLAFALIAIWQCPLHWAYLSVLSAVICMGSIIIYLPTRRIRTLALLHDQSWRYDDGTMTHCGLTTSGSYRSAVLIVVAIKSADSKTQHAIVWQDSVPASTFSALHIQLATTSPDQLQ